MTRTQSISPSVRARSGRLAGARRTPYTRRPSARATLRSTLGLTLALGLAFACEPEKPPAPTSGADVPAQDPRGAVKGEAETARLLADNERCVLTYAGERGVFKDTNKLEDVPEEARGMVRVSLLDGPRPRPGTVWVANLKVPDAEGGYTLSTVPRDQYEEYALGQGRSSKLETPLPEGLEPPPKKPREADVIVYKTDWCGVCKQLIAYLDRKGVRYVAKDIEKDSGAAAELQAKAKEKGVKTGSVPVVDVRGELMVGFNRARLEQLL